MTPHRDTNRDMVPGRIFASSTHHISTHFFSYRYGCTQSSGLPSNRSSRVWETTELTMSRTDEVFTVSSFSDRSVLIQSFTITCPICMKQQEEITRLAESGDVPFVMIGLDIDPNGDVRLLRQYTEQKGYAGLYCPFTPVNDTIAGRPVRDNRPSPGRGSAHSGLPDGTATLLPSGIKDDAGPEAGTCRVPWMIGADWIVAFTPVS